jgi:DNA-binding PadR family transcriptional regulator
MSRQATTELAVLGALSVQPMSGYAVRAAIAETLGHFWSESFGQIYPTLSRLEADGLVVRDAEGKTSGSTYRLTASGRRRLVALLQEPIASAPPRNGTLLRLFFGELLGADAARELLEDARARAEQQLDVLDAIRTELEMEIADDEGARYRLVTVLAGQHSARAQIAWAHESLALLTPDPIR